MKPKFILDYEGTIKALEEALPDAFGDVQIDVTDVHLNYNDVKTSKKCFVTIKGVIDLEKE